MSTRPKRREQGDGLPPPEDLGRVTSSLLTEVRTVLSRAQTALADLPEDPRWWIIRREHVFGQPDENGRRQHLGMSEGVSVPHPEGRDMLAALRKVVELLEPWERTGR